MKATELQPAQLARRLSFKGIKKLRTRGTCENDPNSCRALVQQMQKLEELRWYQQSIDPECANILSSHASLTVLDLSEAILPAKKAARRQVLRSLLRIPQLQQLSLVGCKQITEGDVAWLERHFRAIEFPHLECVYIVDNATSSCCRRSEGTNTSTLL